MTLEVHDPLQTEAPLATVPRALTRQWNRSEREAGTRALQSQLSTPYFLHVPTCSLLTEIN
jgi:hypothetical protein